MNSQHCAECGRAFSRIDSLQRHLLEKHQIGGGAKRPHEQDDEIQVAKRLKKDADPRQFYDITNIKEQRMPKLEPLDLPTRYRSKHIEVTDDVLSALKRMFATIIEELTN